MRALGAACLLAVSLLFCRAIGEHERRRVCETEEVLALLRAIKAGITCGLMPLGEIYTAFDAPYLSASGFLVALRESGELSAAARHGVLPDGVQSRLAAFGGSLGRSGKDRESELCDYYISELEGELQRVRSESAVRLGSRRVVAVTGALMLVLLLL